MDRDREHIGKHIWPALRLALLAAGLFLLLARSGEARTPLSGAQPAYGGSPTATATPECGPAWRVVDSPNSGAYHDYLVEVSVLAPDDIWAVGYHNSGYDLPNQTLVEHWDGSQWSVVPSPNDGAGYNELWGIAAIAPDDIWAVGYARDENTPQSPYRTLAMHWNGSKWSVVPTPNVGAVYNSLSAVAAISSGDVWAVGFSREDYDFNTPYRTLAMHWDGSTWSVVPSPNDGERSNRLFGVAAIAADDVWAVGSGWGVTLTIHWDGTKWSVVPSPNRDNSSYLYAVAAASPGEVWAAGSSTSLTSGNRGLTLAMRWDGAQWDIVPSPNISTTYNELNGIAAAGPGELWAVGRHSSGFESSTLVEHWDGAQWTIVPGPAVGTGDDVQNSFLAVAAVSSTDIWAVGYARDEGLTRTLVERYHDPCVTATATPEETSTPAPTSTDTPTAQATPTGTGTPAACTISFIDTAPSDYFYEAVRYLYCRGVVSGYADGTFRPFNSATRGQVAKIVVLAEGWPIYAPPDPTFTDVPAGHAFYRFVETAYNRGIISGYADGTFRPQNTITRGQLCKIAVLAEGWATDTEGGPHFSDVPTSHTFYAGIETAYNRGVISGYADGTFRPGSSATRGQICKIVFQITAAP